MPQATRISSIMVIDSIFPNHIFNDRTLFTTYTRDPRTYTTPVGKKIKIKGTGTVVIHLTAGGWSREITLYKCWHVPTSSNNFYSCIYSTSKGWGVRLDSNYPHLVQNNGQSGPLIPLSRSATDRYLLNFTHIPAHEDSGCVIQ